VLGGGAEDLGEEIRLRREVAVDRPGRDPGAGGDRGDRGGPEPALGDELARGTDDPPARLAPAGLGRRRRPVRHTKE
jgi:hypothetical protein